MDIEKAAELRVRILEAYAPFFNGHLELTEFCQKVFKEVFGLPMAS